MTEIQTARPAPALDRQRVVTEIGSALAVVLKRDDAVLAEDTKLFDDLGLDSTSVLELLMRIEDDLDVEFDTETLEQEHFRTIGTLADYVVQQAGA